MNEPRPLRGMLLILCATFLFACMDSSAKYLAASFSVFLLAFARYAVHLVLLLVIAVPRYGFTMMRAQRPVLVVVRALSLVAMTLFMMLGLQRIPLAEATAIGFVGPLLVVLLARPILGEKIGLLRWLAVIAGFAGVLLVVRPGANLAPMGVFYVLMMALCMAAYQLLSRVLVGSESTLTLLFYAGLVGVLCFGTVLPWTFDGNMPTGWSAVLTLGLGVFGGLGHYLFTHAYRDAPASLLAPLSYSQLLWAGLLGFVVFGRIPDPLSALGMFIIAAAGVTVALQQRRQKSQA